MAVQDVLRKWRELRPEDKDRPDNELILNIGKGMRQRGKSTNDFEFDKRFNELRDTELPSAGESASAQFRAGVEDLKSTAVSGTLGLASLATKAVGEKTGIETIEKIGDFGLAKTKEFTDAKQQESAFLTSTLQTDLTSAETIDQKLNFFLGGAGRVTPDVIASVGTGLLAAGAGTAVGPEGTVAGGIAGLFGRKMVVRSINNRIKKKLKDIGSDAALEIAESAVKRKGKHAFVDAQKQVIARLTPIMGESAAKNAAKSALGNNVQGWVVKSQMIDSFVQNSGEQLNTLITDPRFEDLDTMRSLTAVVGGGALAGAMDSLVPVFVSKRIFGNIKEFSSRGKRAKAMSKEMRKTFGSEDKALKFINDLKKNIVSGRQIAKRAGKNLGLDSLGEAFTESMQTIVGEMSHKYADPEYEIDYDQLQRDMVNSAALGAMGGAQGSVLGSGTDVLSTRKRNKDINETIKEFRQGTLNNETAQNTINDTISKIDEQARIISSTSIDDLRATGLSSGELQSFTAKEVKAFDKATETLSTSAILSPENIELINEKRELMDRLNGQIAQIRDGAQRKAVEQVKQKRDKTAKAQKTTPEEAVDKEADTIEAIFNVINTTRSSKAHRDSVAKAKAIQKQMADDDPAKLTDAQIDSMRDAKEVAELEAEDEANQGLPDDLVNTQPTAKRKKKGKAKKGLKAKDVEVQPDPSIEFDDPVDLSIHLSNHGTAKQKKAAKKFLADQGITDNLKELQGNLDARIDEQLQAQPDSEVISIPTQDASELSKSSDELQAEAAAADLEEQRGRQKKSRKDLKGMLTNIRDTGKSVIDKGKEKIKQKASTVPDVITDPSIKQATKTPVTTPEEQDSEELIRSLDAEFVAQPLELTGSTEEQIEQIRQALQDPSIPQSVRNEFEKKVAASKEPKPVVKASEKALTRQKARTGEAIITNAFYSIDPDDELVKNHVLTLLSKTKDGREILITAEAQTNAVGAETSGRTRWVIAEKDKSGEGFTAIRLKGDNNDREVAKRGLGTDTFNRIEKIFSIKENIDTPTQPSGLFNKAGRELETSVRDKMLLDLVEEMSGSVKEDEGTKAVEKVNDIKDEVEAKTPSTKADKAKDELIFQGKENARLLEPIEALGAIISDNREKLARLEDEIKQKGGGVKNINRKTIGRQGNLVDNKFRQADDLRRKIADDEKELSRLQGNISDTPQPSDFFMRKDMKSQVTKVAKKLANDKTERAFKSNEKDIKLHKALKGIIANQRKQLKAVTTSRKNKQNKLKIREAAKLRDEIDINVKELANLQASIQKVSGKEDLKKIDRILKRLSDIDKELSLVSREMLTRKSGEGSLTEGEAPTLGNNRFRLEIEKLEQEVELRKMAELKTVNAEAFLATQPRLKEDEIPLLDIISPNFIFTPKRRLPDIKETAEFRQAVAGKGSGAQVSGLSAGQSRNALVLKNTNSGVVKVVRVFIDSKARQLSITNPQFTDSEDVTNHKTGKAKNGTTADAFETMRGNYDLLGMIHWDVDVPPAQIFISIRDEAKFTKLVGNRTADAQFIEEDDVESLTPSALNLTEIEFADKVVEENPSLNTPAKIEEIKHEIEARKDLQKIELLEQELKAAEDFARRERDERREDIEETQALINDITERLENSKTELLEQGESELATEQQVVQAISELPERAPANVEAQAIRNEDIIKEGKTIVDPSGNFIGVARFRTRGTDPRIEKLREQIADFQQNPDGLTEVEVSGQVNKLQGELDNLLAKSTTAQADVASVEQVKALEKFEAWQTAVGQLPVNSPALLDNDIWDVWLAKQEPTRLRNNKYVDIDAVQFSNGILNAINGAIVTKRSSVAQEILGKIPTSPEVHAQIDTTALVRDTFYDPQNQLLRITVTTGDGTMIVIDASEGVDVTQEGFESTGLSWDISVSNEAGQFESIEQSPEQHTAQAIELLGRPATNQIEQAFAIPEELSETFPTEKDSTINEIAVTLIPKEFDFTPVRNLRTIAERRVLRKLAGGGNRITQPDGEQMTQERLNEIEEELREARVKMNSIDGPIRAEADPEVNRISDLIVDMKNEVDELRTTDTSILEAIKKVQVNVGLQRNVSLEASQAAQRQREEESKIKSELDEAARLGIGLDELDDVEEGKLAEKEQPPKDRQEDDDRQDDDSQKEQTKVNRARAVSGRFVLSNAAADIIADSLNSSDLRDGKGNKIFPVSWVTIWEAVLADPKIDLNKEDDLKQIKQILNEQHTNFYNIMQQQGAMNAIESLLASNTDFLRDMTAHHDNPQLVSESQINYIFNLIINSLERIQTNEQLSANTITEAIRQNPLAQGKARPEVLSLIGIQSGGQDAGSSKPRDEVPDEPTDDDTDSPKQRERSTDPIGLTPTPTLPSANLTQPNSLQDWLALIQTDTEEAQQKLDDAPAGFVQRIETYLERFGLVGARIESLTEGEVKDEAFDILLDEMQKVVQRPANEAMQDMTDLFRNLSPDSFPSPLKSLQNEFLLKEETVQLLDDFFSRLSEVSVGLSDTLQIRTSDVIPRTAEFRIKEEDGAKTLKSGTIFINKNLILNEAKIRGVSADSIVVANMFHEAGHFLEASVLGEHYTRFLFDKLSIEDRAAVLAQYKTITKKQAKELLETDPTGEHNKIARQEWVAGAFVDVAKGQTDKALKRITKQVGEKDATNMIDKILAVWGEIKKIIADVLSLPSSVSKAEPTRELSQEIENVWQSAQNIGGARIKARQQRVQRFADILEKAEKRSKEVAEGRQENLTGRAQVRDLHPERPRLFTRNPDSLKGVKITKENPADILEDEKIEYTDKKIEHIKENEKRYQGARSPDAVQRLAINYSIDNFMNDLRASIIADGAGVGKTVMQLIIANEITLRARKGEGRAVIVTKGQPIIFSSYINDAIGLGLKVRTNIKTETSLTNVMSLANMYGINRKGPRGLRTLSEMKKMVASAMDRADPKIELIIYEDLNSNKYNPKHEFYDSVILDEAQIAKNLGTTFNKKAFSIPTNYRVFASATLADRPESAAFFVGQVLGKDRITDTGYVKSGNDFNKLPSVTDEQLLERLEVLQQEMMSKGLMVRREYPFWGQPDDIDEDFELSDEDKAEFEEMQAYFNERIRGTGRFKVPDGAAQARKLREESRWLETKKAHYIFQKVVGDMVEGRKPIVMAQTSEDQYFEFLNGGTKAEIKAKGKKEGMTAKEAENKFIIRDGLLTTLQKMLLNPTDFGYSGDGISRQDISIIAGSLAEDKSFQDGDTMIALAGIQKAQAGIDLDDQIGDGNNERVMYVATIPEAGDAFEQIIGRVSRRNSKSPALISWLSSNYQSDIARYNTLIAKLKTLKALSGSDAINVLSEREPTARERNQNIPAGSPMTGEIDEGLTPLNDEDQYSYDGATGLNLVPLLQFDSLRAIRVAQDAIDRAIQTEEKLNEQGVTVDPITKEITTISEAITVPSDEAGRKEIKRLQLRARQAKFGRQINIPEVSFEFPAQGTHEDLPFVTFGSLFDLDDKKLGTPAQWGTKNNPPIPKKLGDLTPVDDGLFGPKGGESVAYRDGQGNIYKFNYRAYHLEQTLAKQERADHGVVPIDRGTLPSVTKSMLIDAMGVPTEIQGIMPDGSLLIKQKELRKMTAEEYDEAELPDTEGVAIYRTPLGKVDPFDDMLMSDTFSHFIVHGGVAYGMADFGMKGDEGVHNLGIDEDGKVRIFDAGFARFDLDKVRDGEFKDFLVDIIAESDDAHSELASEGAIVMGSPMTGDEAKARELEVTKQSATQHALKKAGNYGSKERVLSVANAEWKEVEKFTNDIHKFLVQKHKYRGSREDLVNLLGFMSKAKGEGLTLPEDMLNDFASAPIDFSKYDSIESIPDQDMRHQVANFYSMMLSKAQVRVINKSFSADVDIEKNKKKLEKLEREDALLTKEIVNATAIEVQAKENLNKLLSDLKSVTRANDFKITNTGDLGYMIEQIEGSFNQADARRYIPQIEQFINELSKDQLALFDILNATVDDKVDFTADIPTIVEALKKSSDKRVQIIATNTAHVAALIALGRSSSNIMAAIELRRLPELRQEVEKALSGGSIEIITSDGVKKSIGKNEDERMRNAVLIGLVRRDRAAKRTKIASIREQNAKLEETARLGGVISRQLGDKLENVSVNNFGATTKGNIYDGTLLFVPPDANAAFEDVLKSRRVFNYMDLSDIDYAEIKKKQDEWLDNQSNRDRYPHLWSNMNSQRDRMLRFVFDNNMYRSRTVANMMYASIPDRLRRMGLPQTRAAGRMFGQMEGFRLNSVRRIEKAGRDSGVARRDLMKAMTKSLTKNEFIKMIDTPSKRVIEDFDVDIRDAYNQLIKNEAVRPLIQNNFKEFEKYIIAERDNFKLFAELADEFGLHVTDDRIWIPDYSLDINTIAPELAKDKPRKGVQNVGSTDFKVANIKNEDGEFERVVLVPVERAHFNLGSIGTFMLKSDFAYLRRMAKSMRKEDSKIDAWDGEITAIIDAIKANETLGEKGRQSEEINALFNTESTELFLMPLIKMDKHDAFDWSDKDTNLLAWDESGGDVSIFLDTLYDKVKIEQGMIGSDGRIMSRAEWKMRQLKNLRGYYNSFISDFNEAEPSNDYHTAESAPRTGIDARKRAFYPAEWTEYRMGGVKQNNAWLGHLSFHAAMGKDGENYFKALESARVELVDLKDELTRITNEVREEGLSAGKAIARAKELMGKERYDRAQRADGFIDDINSVEQDTRNMFTSELGPFRDLDTLSKAMSTAILGTLNGPRAAFSQFNDLLSTIFKTGLSTESVKVSFLRLGNTSRNMFGSMLGALGMHVGEMPKYRALLKETHGIDPDVGVSPNEHLKQLVSEMGFEDEFRQDEEAVFKRVKSLMSDSMKKEGLGGKDLKRGLDILNSMMGRGISNVSTDKAQYSAFNALAAFSWSVEQLNESTMMVTAMRFDELAARGVKFLREHEGDTDIFLPDGTLRDDFKFSDHKNALGYSEVSIGGVTLQFGGKAFDYYNDEVLRGFVGTRLEDIAFNNLNKKDGSNPYTTEQYRMIMSKVLADTAGEASLLTRTASKGPLEKFMLPLLGWSIHRQGIFASMFKDKDGQVTVDTVATGVMILSGMLLPATMAFSAFRDWYDEYVMGKKSRLKPMTGDDWVVNVIERFTREGTMGLQGEVLNLVANTAAGGGGDIRTLSIDQRVFVINSFRTMLNAIGTWRNQDFTATYPTVWRPFISAIGGTGALQWMQLTGHHLGWDNLETKYNARGNARNWLMSAGHMLGKEVRPFSGSAISNAVTPHVTNMLIGAASNNRGDFDEAWEKAVKAAMKLKKIDAIDAQAFVRNSYSSRHPLKNLFRTALTTSEARWLIQQIPSNGRQDVNEMITLTNQFGQSKGIKPYFGKKEPKKSRVNVSSAYGFTDIF
jgi:hypothetical protein